MLDLGFWSPWDKYGFYHILGVDVEEIVFEFKGLRTIQETDEMRLWVFLNKKR